MEYGLSLIIAMLIPSFITDLIIIIDLNYLDSDLRYSWLISNLGYKTGLSLPITFLIFILFIWPQGAKRCHDYGKSGWLQLIPFYPIYMLFKEGDIGPNQYRDDPKKRVVVYQNAPQDATTNAPTGYNTPLDYNGGHNANSNAYNASGYTPYAGNPTSNRQDEEFRGSNPYVKNK